MAEHSTWDVNQKKSRAHQPDPEVTHLPSPRKEMGEVCSVHLEPMVTNDTNHSPGEEVETTTNPAWRAQIRPTRGDGHTAWRQLATEQKKSPVEDEGFEWCEELVFHQPTSV